MKRFILGIFFTAWTAGVAGAEPQEAQRASEKPINLKVSSSFEGGTAVATLAWQDQSDNEVGFEIIRSDNGGEFRVIGMVGTNTSRYRDKIGKYITGVFVYKVFAFNEVGKSKDSNNASVWF